MPCIEPTPGPARARRRPGAGPLPVALGGLLLAAGCSAPPPAPAPVVDVRPPVAAPVPAPAPAPVVVPAPAPAPSALSRPARTWAEYRIRAAHRLVEASPGVTYDGRPPEPLLGIPVLEVELNADGSVRRIEVLRRPGQAPDTAQLAINAVRRAGSFGSVSHLPRPWRFTETFLFDHQRRFKPRSLDNP